MTSAEIWVAVAGLVSVVGLILDHLSRRTPAREVNDALAEINAKLEAHDGRIVTLESWKKS